MSQNSPWMIRDPKTIQLMENYSEDRRFFSKGSYINRYDEPVHYLFFVLEGRVQIISTHLDGQEKTLAIQEPGTFFGDSAFFDGYPGFAASKAIADTVVLTFDHRQVSHMFSKEPAIVLEVLKSMALKVRLLTFQVECLSFFDNEHRTVAILLNLFNTRGAACATILPSCYDPIDCISGVRLTDPISDHDLGGLLGICRETVTKQIGKLRRQGLINKKNRVLCCPHPQTLSEHMQQ